VAVSSIQIPTVRNPFTKKMLLLVIAFLLLFSMQSLWVAGQMNAFNLNLVRIWTPITLELTHKNCFSIHDTETLQQMQTWLNESTAYHPNTDHYLGALHCLRGDVIRAEESWDQNQDYLISSLYAALLSFSHAEIIATSFSEEIGGFGYQNGYQAKLSDNLPEAISWYFFSIAYDPSIRVARQIEYMYRMQGDGDQAEYLWQNFTQVVAQTTPLYWWSRGVLAIKDDNREMAADHFYRSGSLAEGDEAYYPFVQAGIQWFYVKDYESASEAFYKAGSLNIDYVRADLDEHYPYLWLGKVAQAQRKYDEALAFLDQALSLNPISSGALYEKALVLETIGRRQAAIGSLTKAIANHINPPENWQELLAEWK
jgi:tetratricopeptide (TPR) repeat protein